MPPSLSSRRHAESRPEPDDPSGVPAPSCAMRTGPGGEEETLKGTEPEDEQEEALRTAAGMGDAPGLLLGEASRGRSLSCGAWTQNAGVAGGLDEDTCSRCVGGKAGGAAEASSLSGILRWARMGRHRCGGGRDRARGGVESSGPRFDFWFSGEHDDWSPCR